MEYYTFKCFKDFIKNLAYELLFKIADLKTHYDDYDEIIKLINTENLNNLLCMENLRLYSLNQKYKTNFYELISMIRIDNYNELYNDYRYFIDKIFKEEYNNMIERMELFN